MAEKTRVTVVDAKGNIITVEPETFKPEPPKTCEAVVQELQAAEYGDGLLKDKDGDTVLRHESGPAGNYQYKLTGDCCCVL